MAQSTWLRVLFLALFVNTHQSVLRLLNKVVPTPYLDEIFHVPQAQKYWLGKWTDWDSKITTPPGVYLWSYLFNTIRGGRGDDVSTEDLRFSNAVLLYVLVLGLTLWTTIARRQADTSAVLQKEFVVVAFPLLFFFSGLYYTDLFSALTVVLTYVAWEGGVRYKRRRWLCHCLHLTFGLLSLASRQTNIFWVGVFLAGLQIVESVKDRVGVVKVHDPDIGNAWVEDAFYFVLSIIKNIFSTLPYLMFDLWPQLALLASFAAFVVWNGGVVLGDKQNHIATIHTPQLLYIWPMITFFSWPVMISSLAAQLQPLSWTNLRNRLPRAWISALILAVMTASVHFNTIVHPFTLADNRHYTFYVFRILTRSAWLKYAAVPVYFSCSWLVFAALGHASPPSASASTLASKPKSKSKSAVTSISKSTTQHQQTEEIQIQTEEKNNVSLSFTLIWLISTTLSLVTAPLVEPRYFIIPWLIWRLNVPEPMYVYSSSSSSSFSPTSNSSTTTHRLQRIWINYALWIELGWHVIVNLVTTYIFLYWEFTWVQEPGQIQRFMW